MQVELPEELILMTINQAGLWWERFADGLEMRKISGKIIAQIKSWGLPRIILRQFRRYWFLGFYTVLTLALRLHRQGHLYIHQNLDFRFAT